jgi:PKHD-type hydroxylase
VTAWPPDLVVEQPNALDAHQCDLVVSLMAELGLTQGVVARQADDAPGVDDSVRRVRQAVLPRTAATAPVYERVAEAAHAANRASFGFELGDLEDLVVVEYGPGDFFNWHLDLGPAAPTRKLSLSIALSSPDEYTGGAITFPGREVGGTARGTAVVFPSFLLHGVQPVTRGLRRVLLAWVGGPRFR